MSDRLIAVVLIAFAVLGVLAWGWHEAVQLPGFAVGVVTGLMIGSCGMGLFGILFMAADSSRDAIKWLGLRRAGVQPTVVYDASGGGLPTLYNKDAAEAAERWERARSLRTQSDARGAMNIPWHQNGHAADGGYDG